MIKGRIAGIDYGVARIGIALSDPMQILASAHKTVLNKSKDEAIAQIVQIMNENRVCEIVIGMPYHLDGKIGTSANLVLEFIELLKTKIDIPIKTWDERLTTTQTERVMKASNVSRKKRTKVIDAACAALILQSYLDQKSFS